MGVRSLILLLCVASTGDREILGRERSEVGFRLLCAIAALGILFLAEEIELPAIYVFLIEESERPFVKERQAKRAEIQKKHWVSYLIGLLPSEMSQIIAREDEEVTEDYEKIKALLLKRYKLTPERFRQLFVNHNKSPENTWTDFVYEVKNYFHEWFRGSNVKTFEELSNLIITEQIKKSVG
ncbi:hypothetical protein AVEN_222557-1 [Araneus ventricosus]|uniref:Uncharacterized protein n=1 Tax=Araneus ventricosus TaxID=182803 RepID=A0A4Y2H060_ARAVE|nr:hypothetical protein AVEN_222557-1 [Araneus ventricosus]